MAKLLFVLAMILATVGAYCPNGCTKHGSCGTNDKCTCYNRPNGDPAWTGHDCSQRTCPKGDAWTAEVVEGENSSHPRMECSNKGLCDRNSGECRCFENYDGKACERTLCPNDCSGRGICLPQKSLAALQGATYTAPWDADKHLGCKCDDGYRGSDCSQKECPSGADILGGDGGTEDAIVLDVVFAIMLLVFADASRDTLETGASTKLFSARKRSSCFIYEFCEPTINGNAWFGDHFDCKSVVTQL
eukprot:CAMPEP_0201610892 /NCGR_PEP_ID=MMETSP0492-20130828/18304_1 /ASSEMBLY_ACC=CAM_ASM_000837 /TAXON_ID=420259 /ORGANISM="Thalassiosira gravida, Strain GMp14c1" /LENGTH=245 /DNA_ID=CAMNT_0048076875 /DNA_START=53 /DNA_END=791 /DNA_ORIENTATION=-